MEDKGEEGEKQRRGVIGRYIRVWRRNLGKKKKKIVEGVKLLYLLWLRK